MKRDIAMTMRLDHSRLTGLSLDKVREEGERLANEPTPLHDEVDRRLRVTRLQYCPTSFIAAADLKDALAPDWPPRSSEFDRLVYGRWHYTDADLEDQDPDDDTTPTDVVLPTLPHLTRESFARAAFGDEARARYGAEKQRARAVVHLRRIIVAALSLAVVLITGIAHVLTGAGVL